MLGQVQGEGRSAPKAPPPGARAAPTRLDPAGSSSSSSLSQLGTPSARGAEPSGMASAFAVTAAAPPPAPQTDDGSTRGDSVHRSISIHADGSAHGGRRYFDGQANGQQRQDHLAVWVVEDGSTRSASSQQQQRQQRDGSVKAGGAGGGGGDGGGSGSLAVNGSGGHQKGDFGRAEVLIEEADGRELFDWGTYFSSLPKKLKGARPGTSRGSAGAREGPPVPCSLCCCLSALPGGMHDATNDASNGGASQVSLRLSRSRCHRSCPACRRAGHAAANPQLAQHLLVLAGRLPGCALPQRMPRSPADCRALIVPSASVRHRSLQQAALPLSRGRPVGRLRRAAPPVWHVTCQPPCCPARRHPGRLCAQPVGLSRD